MIPPESAENRRANQEAIEEAASRWLVEHDEGLNPERTREFERWLAADVLHAEAYDRMEQAHGLLEKLPFARDHLVEYLNVDQVPASRSIWRWRSLAGAAAMVALAAVAWWQWPIREPAGSVRDYATAPGGYERAVLEDGSVLEMNTGTKLQVTFSAAERRVTLLAGEAHFSVAHDVARPFVVTAGDYSVCAVGTAFVVRYARVEVEVLVTEGKVLVAPKEAMPSSLVPDDHAPLIAAGQRVVIAAGSVPSAKEVETIAPTEMRAALAWQERRLVFADTPLRDVIVQFNQRNSVQLSLAEAALGDKRVGGTFAANNVEAFVRLLESSGDIVSERRTVHEIVLHQAP